MSDLGTILWLRRRMAIRELSNLAGALNLAAGIALTAVATLGALAVAAGLGFVLGMAVVSENPDARSLAWSLCLWTVSFFALGVPVIVGAGDTAFDPSRLLRFPLSRRRLYHLSLASEFVSKVHLAWYPTVATAAVVGVLVQGPARVGPMVLLTLFTATMVVWSNTLLLVVRRILRHRRLREIASVIGLAMVLVIAFLPASIDLDPGAAERRVTDILTLPDWARSASAVLPPSIAVRSLAHWHEGLVSGALVELAWLAVWFAAGWAAGDAAFARLLVAGRSSSGPSPARSTSRPRGLGRLLDHAPPPVAAVATKELRYLFRSGVGRISLVVLPLLTALTATLSGHQAEVEFFGISIGSAVFLGVMIYAAALMGYLQVNTFSWEASGFCAYFTSPVRPREVVLGKNLGIWVFTSLLAAEGILVWSVIRGLPGPAVLITGTTAFATTVVLLSVVGNFTSIAFPVARPIATVTSSASPVGTLVMIGCLLVALSVTGVATLAATITGAPVLQPTVALGFLGLVALVYRWALGPASAALGERREDVARALRSD
jgi:hypothetical protein